MNNIHEKILYKKTKIIYRILLISIALLIIIAMSAAIYYETQKTPPIEPKSRILTEYEYLLKSVDGKVVVFKTGEEKPIKTLSVYLDSLPTADKMELINGIPIENEAALSKAIEDFTS